jgi:hypothetical protein
MIKAILRNGHIQPLEPLPPNWTDGQELVVEQPQANTSREEIEKWADDLDLATANISPEDQARFEAVLDEIERESKEAVRREWITT